MATQQEVIKKIMTTLDTTSLKGVEALDAAIKACSNFSNFQDFKTKLISDCKSVGDSETFLRDYCGIIISNTDTGAITGSDAENGTVKTAKSIVPENSDLKNFTGNEFTIDGLTVKLGKGGGTDKVESRNFSNLSTQEKYIWQSLYSYWLKSGLELIGESYGENFSFNDKSSAVTKTLYIIFDDTNNNILASTWGGPSNAKKSTNAMELHINLKFYGAATGEDGIPDSNQSYLDRIIAHELTHAVMRANIDYFDYLPKWFKEGMAELTHGIDDNRTSDIKMLAGNSYSLQRIFSDVSISGVKAPSYSGGYIALRYLAKQAADTYTKNFSGTDDDDQFETHNDFITISGGKGNDTLTNYGGKVLINYAAGDGNDLIQGFNATSTLSISGGAYSTIKNGADLIVNVGNGFITLKNAVSLKTLNIDGEEIAPTVTYNADSATKVTMASGFEVGDASSRTTAIKITGNALDNSILGGSGKDSLYGGNGNDYLVGNAGADKLYGQNGDDTLIGGEGNDTLTGGNGNDLFIYEAGKDLITDMSATDTLQIGNGTDTYIRRTASDNIIVTVGNGLVTLKGAATLSALNILGEEIAPTVTYDADSAAKVTMASGFEIGDASGRTTAIKITGNALDNSILGGSGKDSLYGGDGDDYLVGNAGADKLYGQNGDDTLIGGEGNDTLTGGSGNDLFIYEAGKDLITDMSATDTLQIGNGTDTYIRRTNGDNIIVTVGNGLVTLKNAVSLKTLNIDGEEIAPTVTYDADSAAKVTMASGFEIGDASGRTTAIKITGNALDNSILGGSGKDTLYGGDGNDYLVGNAGADKLYGQNGDDTLIGGEGNDTLTGGSGNDLFIYEAGKDLITDMSATDTLQIGNGTDTYIRRTAGDNIIVTVGNGLVTLKGAATLSAVNILGEEIAPTVTYDADSAAKVTMASGFEIGDASGRTTAIKITGNALDNSILGGSGKDSLYGGDGDDYLVGNAGADKLYGQNGDDTLIGGEGNDTLTGGNGNDLFIYEAGKDLITDMSATDTLQIGNGTDTYIRRTNGDNIIVTVGNGLVTLKGAATLSALNIIGEEIAPTVTYNADSAAKVTMASGFEIGDASSRTTAIKITGNALDNSILGGSGKDSLYGGNGNDYLVGNTGADKLYGQNGNDTLWGGIGNDTLTGGAGADTFIYNSGEGKDVISDFSDDDLLKITGTFSATHNELKNTIAFKVGSTASAITLKNFTASTFNINGEVYTISENKLVK